MEDFHKRCTKWWDQLGKSSICEVYARACRSAAGALEGQEGLRHLMEVLVLSESARHLLLSRRLLHPVVGMAAVLSCSSKQDSYDVSGHHGDVIEWWASFHADLEAYPLMLPYLLDVCQVLEDSHSSNGGCSS